MTPLLASTEGTGSIAIDLLIILAVAGMTSLVLGRLRFATIPGYLVAGALIGQHAFGLVTDDEEIAAISGLAIILLMFTIGLHLDVSAIRSRLVQMLSLGVISTLASTLLLIPVGMLFGLTLPSAAAAAMALSISSTAVVLRLLMQHRQMRAPFGRICVGVSIVQDLLSLAFLALLPVLAHQAGVAPTAVTSMAGAADINHAAMDSASARVLDVAWKALATTAGIGLLLAFGRLALPRLLQEASRVGGTEVMLVLASAAALGAAVLTSALGFSPELGAFLAGFMLAGTPFRHQLSGQLSPVRDLFMAVFFTAVGLRLDLGVVMEHWWAIGLAVVLVMGIKALAIGLTAWGLGAAASIALPVGVVLCQGGEFSLVIAGVAAELNLLDETSVAALIAVVFVGLVATPPLYSWADRARATVASVPPPPWLAKCDLGEEPPNAESGSDTPEGQSVPAARPIAARSVIIAGFGVVGRSVADRLEDAKVPFSVVDLNPSTIRTQRKLGRTAHYGDITNPEVLESAGIHSADAIVLTIPDDEATIRACQAIRAIAPSIFIAARTNFLSKAMQATTFGADHVTVEEVATAEAMGQEVIDRLCARAALKDGAPPNGSDR